MAVGPFMPHKYLTVTMTTEPAIQQPSTNAHDSATPRKVLFLIDKLMGMGGAEGALAKIVRYLPPYGFSCSIGAFGLTDNQEFLDNFPCPIYNLPLTCVYNLQAARVMRELRQIVAREKFDIIHTMFPSSDLYASLFPERAQKLIGEVGEDTRGVQRMLERIGFKYVNHIDPFDGGPHYEADLKDVSLIRRHRTAKVSAEDFEIEGDEMMVGREKATGKNRFRAVRCSVRFEDQVVHLPGRAKELLEAKPGDKVALIPFE